MTIVVDINPARVPIKLRELRKLHAADPWQGGAATAWTISLFRLVPRNYAVGASWKEAKRPQTSRGPGDDPGPQGRALARDEAVGLEAADGRLRLLPRVLFDRWRGGGLDEAMLPALLHRLEPALRRGDFRPLPPLFALPILALVPALAILGLAALLVGAVRLPGLGAEARPVFLVMIAIMLTPILLMVWLFFQPRRHYRRLAGLIDAPPATLGR